MNAAEQLYEALKALPSACKCRYQIPVGPYNAAAMDLPKGRQVRTFQCARCKALERFEIERDDF